MIIVSAYNCVMQIVSVSHNVVGYRNAFMLDVT